MAELKSVSVRMYRGILGDCFLILARIIENGVEATRSILIDCGVLQHVPSGAELVEKLDAMVVNTVGEDKLRQVVAGPERISAIAEDVLEKVGGRIDLLIITHEHYDHLSGFGVKSDAFLSDDVTIGQLWFAWTENHQDPQANALRARFSKARKALGGAVALVDRLGADTPAKLRNAAALAAFLGPESPRGAETKGPLSTGDIIEMLKAKAGALAVSYLEPGQVVELHGFGLRAYVLGPPREEALLKKDLPSHGHAKEVYLTCVDTAAAADSALSAQLALHGDLARLQAVNGDVTPFAVRHHRPLTSGKRKGQRERKRRSDPVRKLYESDALKWRRIDTDWTGSIEALALKMDADTNNTSLALAFELPDGQVLLFPGDAQVGNWLSWNNQSYPSKPGVVAGGVTAEDLLRRVTFYKAGHHGSHNATLKALGLERMTDPRLTAAIPCVKAVAAVQGKGRYEPGRGWEMPFGALYLDLQKRTNGRVVEGDGDPGVEQNAFAANPTAKVRPVAIAHHDLWVELKFEMA